MKMLESKVALVTGGTSGIGKTTAIAFSNAGAKIVLSGRREQEGEETANLIRRSGLNVYSCVQMYRVKQKSKHWFRRQSNIMVG